jgi:hypothetical protein
MENKDEKLWAIAKKRAAFKKSLFTYLIVNIFLWIIWLVTKGNSHEYSGIPWPIWPTLGWGIGIAFQYFDAYNKTGDTLAEKEYEKLKNQAK